MRNPDRSSRSWKRVPTNHWHLAREMRKEPSTAEKLLWQSLRGRRLGVTFRRQHPLGPFIADFYCVQLGLVIEVDGDSHYADGAEEYDRKRDEYMRELGLVVIRYTNDDVLKNLDGVVADLVKRIQAPP